MFYSIVSLSSCFSFSCNFFFYPFLPLCFVASPCCSAVAQIPVCFPFPFLSVCVWHGLRLCCVTFIFCCFRNPVPLLPLPLFSSKVESSLHIHACACAWTPVHTHVSFSLPFLLHARMRTPRELSPYNSLATCFLARSPSFRHSLISLPLRSRLPCLAYPLTASIE